MTKHKNLPFADVFYQVGRDVGDIQRRLLALEQKQASPEPELWWNSRTVKSVFSK